MWCWTPCSASPSRAIPALPSLPSSTRSNRRPTPPPSCLWTSPPAGRWSRATWMAAGCGPTCLCPSPRQKSAPAPSRAPTTSLGGALSPLRSPPSTRSSSQHTQVQPCACVSLKPQPPSDACRHRSAISVRPPCSQHCRGVSWVPFSPPQGDDRCQLMMPVGSRRVIPTTSPVYFRSPAHRQPSVKKVFYACNSTIQSAISVKGRALKC
mmetsp:Transcript_34265/g.74948  ORF Transcript_34265/g.74948 Transcript_34265/m.74948 type:complete len:209 (+) Transcript_34265:604-1230(+)